MLLFHGTSRRSWRKRHVKPGILYLASQPENALQYAYDTAAYDEEEGYVPEPIVLSVQLDALKGLRRLPDDAAIRSGELPESATWKDTRRVVGSMAVLGSIDKYTGFFRLVLDGLKTPGYAHHGNVRPSRRTPANGKRRQRLYEDVGRVAATWLHQHHPDVV